MLIKTQKLFRGIKYLYCALPAMHYTRHYIRREENAQKKKIKNKSKYKQWRIKEGWKGLW